MTTYIHYITLHYIALHYIALHYITYIQCTHITGVCVCLSLSLYLFAWNTFQFENAPWVCMSVIVWTRQTCKQRAKKKKKGGNQNVHVQRLAMPHVHLHTYHT